MSSVSNQQLQRRRRRRRRQSSESGLLASNALCILGAAVVFWAIFCCLGLPPGLLPDSLLHAILGILLVAIGIVMVTSNVVAIWQIYQICRRSDTKKRHSGWWCASWRVRLQTFVAHLDHLATTSNGKSILSTDEDSSWRVKSIDAASEPWILLALYNGSVRLYRTNTTNTSTTANQQDDDKPMLCDSVTVANCPIRTAKILLDHRYWIITGADDGHVRVLSFHGPTGAVDKTPIHHFVAHRDFIRSLTMIDTRFLVTAADDLKIKVWDMEYNFAPVHTLATGHTRCIMNVLVHPRYSQVIASASTDGTIKLWNLMRQSTAVATVPMPFLERTLAGDTTGVNCLDFFADSNHKNNDKSDEKHSYLVAGCDNGQVQIWDTDTGAIVQNLKRQCARAVTSVRAIPFSGDNGAVLVLVVGYEDGVVILWQGSLRHFEPVHKLNSPRMGRPWCLDMVSHRNTLSIGNDQGCVSLVLHDMPSEDRKHSNSLIGIGEATQWMGNTDESVAATIQESEPLLSSGV